MEMNFKRINTKNKEEANLIEIVNGAHTEVVQDMISGYSLQMSRFKRDVFYTMSEEFPELELDKLSLSKERIAEVLIMIAENHVIDK